ncbi:hypothetical protein GT755_29635 [Herbidospora sp. NEAU-GS84]|uniref:Uncharacterized protein n=1 Tax=Herbidospora solisilvae TaxID=2696284 RepID=A0A7C9N0K6_9ACTN|nr:DUF6348 family protein [Herbidospora solisilvae]NAS25831.1 hypothetical protein [Herbidospora solisilvae]
MDGARLPDDVVLDMVVRHLSDVTGDPWQVQGRMAKGPGTIGVVLQVGHTDHPGHLDLDFVLNVDRPESTTVADCVAGYGATAEEAVNRAIRMWLDTTGSAVLELLRQNGTLAAHFPPDDPEGFPGWHTIHGGIVGWGSGADHMAGQTWAADNVLLPRLAPVLNDGFERDHLIGIKAIFGGGHDADGLFETAEVRVDGVRHEAASRVLAGLGWPRPADGMSFARTFMLLVHRADA